VNWKGYSACELIRHLAAEQTPYLTIRQVVVKLVGSAPADATFKIQMRKGQKGEGLPALKEAEKRKIAALLEGMPVEDPVPIPAKKNGKVRAQNIVEDPGIDPKALAALDDEEWLINVRRYRMPEYEKVFALQMELLEQGFGRDTDFVAHSCMMEAVRRCRRPRKFLQ
jgi:hypothetical protein